MCDVVTKETSVVDELKKAGEKIEELQKIIDNNMMAIRNFRQRAEFAEARLAFAEAKLASLAVTHPIEKNGHVERA